MNLEDLIPKPTKRNWSPFQEEILSSSGPIIVHAVAGGAKTTTLVELSTRRGGAALMLAFNKAIATELCSRVNGATVKTLNALGHSILSRKRPKAKLDAWKVSKRVRQLMDSDDYANFGSQVCRAVSLAKANAHFGEPNPSIFLDLMVSYELEIPSDLLHPLAKVAARAFKETLSNEESFDFDDQLYIPIAENWQFPLFDFVYVDEAQDLSPIQHLMLQALATRGACICAVGDPNQAIYGFRGATSGSMDRLKDTFNMRELPLSVTYRCAKEITRKAQEYVPIIQPHENAIEGTVSKCDVMPEPALFGPTDLIVCRNNAPIFELALAFLKENRPCRVMSNFLEVLEAFIERFDCRQSKDLRIKLDAWYAKEKQECENSGRYGRLAGIEDRFATLSEFCRRYESVDDMIRAIRQLASSVLGPRISTIHKAKGLEADSTFILRPDLLPSPKATSEAQLQAESNLCYVAVTRAKKALIYLPGEGQ